MEIVFSSFILVALTEMGDKTQLLAFVLASRFKNPVAVMSGIFVATIANHGLAAYFGVWVADNVAPNMLRLGLAVSFFGFAVWVLFPDKAGERPTAGRFGAFITTVVVFFIAEIGDKTQLSTVALAARYNEILWVTVGTTMGMLFADGLAVVFGHKLTKQISMKWLRIISAGLFVSFGLGILFSIYK